MVSAKMARYELVAIAIIMFGAAVLLTIASGIGLKVALLQNTLGSLEIDYSLVNFNAAESTLMLVAAFLDTIVFALITVVFASMFFSFITKINIREGIAISRIKKLKNHVIIIPYNTFALEVAKGLSGKGKHVVLAASTRKEFDFLYRQGFLSVIGDPKDVELFESANIKEASHVIACSENDMINTLITITAKSANQHAKIVARVSSESSISKLGMAGAYRMIMPEITAGELIGEEISRRVAL
ncbi:MAG: potassium channel family protein [Candidatus Micrarchaeia archaeon]